jgi:hypothetical protein
VLAAMNASFSSRVTVFSIPRSPMNALRRSTVIPSLS